MTHTTAMSRRTLLAASVTLPAASIVDPIVNGAELNRREAWRLNMGKLDNCTKAISVDQDVGMSGGQALASTEMSDGVTPLARAIGEHQAAMKPWNAAKAILNEAEDVREPYRKAWYESKKYVSKIYNKEIHEQAKRALTAVQLSIGYQEKLDANNAALDRVCDIVQRIANTRPSTIAEFLQKLELLAHHYNGSSFTMVDFFDLALDDLAPLAGIAYEPADETGDLDRDWNRSPREGDAA